MAKKKAILKKNSSLPQDAFVASLATIILVLAYTLVLKYSIESNAGLLPGLVSIDTLDAFIRNILYLLILYPLQAVAYIFASLRLGTQRNPIRIVLLCMPIHIVLIFINASATLYEVSVVEALLRVAGIILLPYLIVGALVDRKS